MDSYILEYSIIEDQYKLSMLAIEHEMFMNSIGKDNIILNEVDELIGKIIATIRTVFDTLIERIKNIFKIIKEMLPKEIISVINKLDSKIKKKKYNNGKMTKHEYAYYLYSEKYKDEVILHNHVEEFMKYNERTENSYHFPGLAIGFYDPKSIDWCYDFYIDSLNKIEKQTLAYLNTANFLSDPESIKNYADKYIKDDETYIQDALKKEMNARIHATNRTTYLGFRLTVNSETINEYNSYIADKLSSITKKEKDIIKFLNKLKEQFEKFAKKDYNNNGAVIQNKNNMAFSIVIDNIKTIEEVTKTVTNAMKYMMEQNIFYITKLEQVYDKIIKYDETKQW